MRMSRNRSDDGADSRAATRSRIPRLTAAVGAAALVVPALTGATAEAPAAADEAKPNDAPGFLQVYDANVENLPTSTETSPAQCAGDWHDLMYYMRTQELKPDVYLVQQLSNKAQLDRLLDRMETHFGEKFSGVLAENAPVPSDEGAGGNCWNYKKRQTNAVIWRTDRLELLKSASPDNRWQAQNWNGKECVNNNQPRTKGVKALLRDKVSGKTVTAASFHWPTVGHGGSKCTMSNIGELSNELTEDEYDTDPTHGSTDLYLAGGDSNAHEQTGGDWHPWYAAANADIGGRFGFRDAVYADCATQDDPDACRADRWTLITKSHRRVDYLLGRKPDGAQPRMTDVAVPTFDEGDLADEELSDDGDRGDLDYSDHRAVGARVHY
ncbi:hypothetical protein DSC45_20245 [Streptomyces sp. YIM 130001]|nr:hypothetical protein DSC45_20245 [Streptomyces sp. YIM 130001]